MSNNNNENNQPTSRVDIMDKQRKRQAQIDTSMDWRSTNNNRMDDYNSNFKKIVESEKLKRVKQGGNQLTSAQIDARVHRMDIIQEAVKNGTYSDPSKPWNRVHRCDTRTEIIRHE